MNGLLTRSSETRWKVIALPVLLVLTAVAGGVAVSGDLGPIALAGLGLLSLGMFALLLASPRIALYLIMAQVSLFPAVPITEGRGVNPIDLILPAALFGAWFWTNAVPRGGGASVGDRALHSIQRGALVYYAVAILSLIVLGLSGRPFDALDSLLVLSRSFSGALFFFLMGRLIRTPAQLRLARNAVLIGLALALVLNSLTMVLADVPRAGAVWVLGDPSTRGGASWSVGIGGWTVTNPNELAMACVLGTALILAMPIGRVGTVLVLVGCLALLMLTLSRSGLLAWLILVATHSLRGGRRSLWLLPLGVVALFPLLPEEFRTRMLRTLTLQKGSFEAYSSLIRVLSWQASSRVFLAHPLFGVGYLGFRFVSKDYNPLAAYLLTSENFFIETASGMGILGLLALVFFVVSVLLAGRALERASVPGSIPYRFARMTPGYLMAVAVSNLTGDVLIGLLGVSQLAVFFGFLVQSGRVEESLRPSPSAAQSA